MSAVRDLPRILRCERCGHYVSRWQVVLRKFNTGACAQCGGRLAPVRDEKATGRGQ